MFEIFPGQAARDHLNDWKIFSKPAYYVFLCTTAGFSAHGIEQKSIPAKAGRTEYQEGASYGEAGNAEPLYPAS